MLRFEKLRIPGLTISHDEFPELTYASLSNPRWKRWFIARMETLSGRRFFARRYKAWRSAIREGKPAMGSMLELLNIKLTLNGHVPDYANLPDGPLVVVANHPYGIGDGVAILSIAERMGRPFRILINSELLKVPEIEPYALPISFSESPDAIRLNLQSRKEALRLLERGVTIVVFPSGGVATAPKGLGRAQDLPWKRFPAKLVMASKANVLPVYFEGQCGRLFHIASHVSMTLRTALLIREFRRLVGREIRGHIGRVILHRELSEQGSRDDLMSRLHDEVFSLAPVYKPRGI